MVTTSEVLDAAADVIVEQGWSKGGDRDDPFYSDDPWCYNDPNGSPCIEGALRLAYMRLTGEDIRNGLELRLTEPYRALEGFLNPRRPSRRLYAWNDVPERHPNEVLAVLRSAAVVERRREQGLEPLHPERELVNV